MSLAVESLERREQLSRLVVMPQSYFQGVSSLDVALQSGWREVGPESTSGAVAEVPSQGESGARASLDYRNVSEAGRTIQLSTSALADPSDGVGSANAWISTQGQYDGGGLLFSLLPSPGQAVGDPIRLKLSASYMNTNSQETAGRNSYKVTYDQVDDAQAGGTHLLDANDSQLLPGQGPVERIAEIDTTVGSVFRIFMALESSTTQAGQPSGQLVVDIESTDIPQPPAPPPGGSTTPPGVPTPPAPSPGPVVTTPTDTTPPRVIAMAPLATPKDAPLRLRITFNEPMDPSTTSDPAQYRLTYTINGRTRRLRIRSVTYEPLTNSLAIALAGKVPARRWLTVTVLGVKDLSGNGLEGGQHSGQMRV